MFSINFIITTFISYMGILFLIAYFVDNKNFLSSARLKPYIYSLSFAIYCTAWTYYGSVGKAVSSGFLFLTVYLGPTLIMFLWPIILRKMIRIKNIFKITSLADLITVRYEKSALIGAFVSLGALFGTVPYISIQLKALITSISILEDRSIELSYTQNIISQNVGILIVVLMVFFTILFGIRKLDPTERHEGMMVIVAIESLVKLFAIMVIGFFVVFFVMDGIPDILVQAQKQNFFSSIAIEKGGDGYANWTSVLMLSMFAIMFLPRQFHVSVVENSSENHISTVMWLLPLYLLLITFFTIPIAMGGSLLNPDTELIDFYVLMIPYEQNAPYLSMVAFIGGFSASTSMIMVTSMTMAIMISNYLLLPIIEFYKPIAIPVLSKIPFIGKIIFTQDIFVYLGYVVAIILGFYLYNTRTGLNLRAVGENPSAADGSGINVTLYKYIHILIGGALCGLGGAYLSIVEVPAWQDNITAGRGWIAIALVIFCKWNPFKALFAAYLFGGLSIVGFRLQHLNISQNLLDALPYLFTIVALVMSSVKKSKENAPPKGLSVPYFREER